MNDVEKAILMKKDRMNEINPFFKEVYQDFKEMEKLFPRILQTEIPLLYQSATYLLKSGGKRIRPGLMLLSASSNRYDRDHLLPFALALEIVHMASLVHDDVVDAAPLRRGKPTVKKKWNNRISVYTGNFLLARAMRLMGSYDDHRINQTLSHVSLEMCKGELSQIDSVFTLDDRMANYLSRIKRKTALLLSMSCEIGAYLGKADEHTVRNLKVYGDYLGMAFQISDDVLDYLPANGKFGKTPGGDIRQGLATLPLIYALHHAKEAEEMRAIFPKQQKTDAEVERVLEIVRNCGGIEFSLGIGRSYIKKAKERLEDLVNPNLKIALGEIADFVMERDF